MEQETREGLENLETTVEAADLAPTPEGVKPYVDFIGDEYFERFGIEGSDANRNF